MADYRLGPSIEATLRALAADARDSIGRCHTAAIALTTGRELAGRGCTDRIARDLECLQTSWGQGPSVDALRDLEIVNTPSIAEVEDWPLFRDAALAKGIRSSLAVPLSRGGRVAGTLTLYSRHVNGFEDCEPLATDFASRAAAVVLHGGTRRLR